MSDDLEFDWDSAVGQLLKYGYVLVPFNEASLIEPILASFKYFVRTREAKGDEEEWKLSPVGDGGEDDLGFFRLGKGDGKDCKEILHYSPRFAAAMQQAGLARNGNVLFFHCERIYQENIKIAREVFKSLERSGYKNFLSDFEGLISNPVAYSEHTLRVGSYAFIDSGIAAKAHYDRSALSIINGEIGGVLRGSLVKDTPLNTREFDLSIPKGKALVFLGVKALILHELSPLWHGSFQSRDSLRQLVAFFAHVPTRVPVISSSHAFQHPDRY